jgi:hypothetical protein
MVTMVQVLHLEELAGQALFCYVKLIRSQPQLQQQALQP